MDEPWSMRSHSLVLVYLVMEEDLWTKRAAAPLGRSVEKPKYDVFLSHATPDKPVVEDLARILKRQGIEPWLDSWNLVPGEPWQEAIELITTGATNSVRRWPLDPDEMIRVACARVGEGRSLTKEEWARYAPPGEKFHEGAPCKGVEPPQSGSNF